MTDDRDLRPDHEMDGRVSTWLSDTDLAPDEATAGLDRLLDEFPVTPQARRRFLGRWLDRDEGVGRHAADHDPPPNTNRRNRLMLSATGITAALAILALSTNVFVTSPTPPGADTPALVVAADGSGDYLTIQEAVDAAADGDTISIRPGNYEESVTVHRDLTILGEADDPSGVVVRIPDDGPSVDFEGMAPRFGFLFDGVTSEIANLTISGPGASVSALVAHGGDLTAHDLIEDLDPYESFPYGFLYMNGAATGDIHDNTTKAFVWFDGLATPTFRDNTVVNAIRSDGDSAPSILDNKVGGIWASGAAAPVVENNVIDFANNGGADGGFSTCGIEVTHAGARPTIIGNTISNALTGICIANGTPVEVSGNRFLDNDVGISLANTDATVKDGVITGAGRGIWVSGTGSPSIVNNDIEVDGIGISLAKGNEAKVYSNTVCGGDGSIVILDGATPEIGDNETCD